MEGRLFTKHTIERMMPSSLDSYGRSIPYSVVKSILDNPKSTEIVVIDGVERKLFYGEELIVVTEELGKIIVTVRYK